MMYPTVSNWVNERNASRVVMDYEHIVGALPEADYTAELKAAEEYNRYLAGFAHISDAVTVERTDESGRYERLLNVNDSRLMGVLQIPKIHVSLPIYHSTDDSVLQIAIGHYQGSSLPIGGESTHAVLSGHRGLPSAKLLTDLDQIEPGDRFYLTILKTVIAYEVDDIQIVFPEEVESLSIRPGEDLVTLVTCTPYGINSHRLLVTGRRIPYDGAMDESNPDKAAGKEHVNPAAADKRPLPVYVYMGFAVVAAGMLGIATRKIRDYRLKRRKRKKNAEKKHCE